MKKTLIVLTLIGIGCLMVACARNIQTHRMQKIMKPEHMTFVNSPIDGTCEEFAKVLMGKGFTMEQERDGKYLLKGNYMRYKNCGITLTPVVNTSKEHKDKVYMAMVSIAPHSFSDDKDTYNHYMDLKEHLTFEFGNPHNTEQYRCARPLPCSSVTEFESPEGVIKLGLEKDGVIDLIYIDKLNGQLNDLSMNNQKDDDTDDGILYEPQKAC